MRAGRQKSAAELPQRGAKWQDLAVTGHCPRGSGSVLSARVRVQRRDNAKAKGRILTPALALLMVMESPNLTTGKGEE